MKRRPPEPAPRRVVAQADVVLVGSRVLRLQVRQLPDAPEEPARLYMLTGYRGELDLPAPVPLGCVSVPAGFIGALRRALAAIERAAA